MFLSRARRFLILSFHLFHTTLQMLYGGWRLSKLGGHIVTIFGSSRLQLNSIYAQKAQEISAKFLQNGVNVLTGGGTGIMQAAGCAVAPEKNAAKSIGIGVKGLEQTPDCMQNYFELDYFYARKWLLSEFSSGFVIFPGGFGTLDEMAGVLTLIQTKKLKRVPVVLIGKEYWALLVEWITKEALGHGTIREDELEFFYVTDDLDEAVCWVVGKCDILPRDRSAH